MSLVDTPLVPAPYLERIRALIGNGQRVLLGLVGPPGAGKSTLAQLLHTAFPVISQVVPMDGFHLANVELARLGRATRKGAPDTFDAAGFRALLRRLRAQATDETIYAPEFRREIEEPIAGAIAVLPQTQLLIVEGNYLLLDRSGWAGTSLMLDEVWYVEVDDALRDARLTQRHEQFGRSPEEARDWVAATDAPNARLIESTRAKATLAFRWS